METKLGKNTVNGYGSLSNGKVPKFIKDSLRSSSFEIENYESPPGAEKQHLIRLENLESYVKSMLESGGFKEQFQVLKNNQLKPWTAGLKPENKSKNRCSEILPYDYNRVILEKTKNDSSSDYINASYIDTYNRKRSYICTQGPLESTLGDFWRMVWQEDVSVICMIGNMFENGKRRCEKYWPDKTGKYSDVTVTLTKEAEFLEYTLRTFKLQKTGSSKSRFVLQYQYTAWPDRGVPPYSLSVLYMMQDIEKFQKKQQKLTPVVLHCSDGASRVGTMVMLASALEMVKAEGRVDVLEILYKMRQQRVNTVGTIEQFIFVYKALVDYHFGDTTRRASEELVLYFNKLRHSDPKLKKTGLQQQYEYLKTLNPVNFSEKCNTALTTVNQQKNRSVNVVPPDDGRPLLKTNPPSNYINAVYVHDYAKEKHFVVTQFPLPNTVLDFWQMLHDLKSSAVVVLNEVNRNDETCPQFWPTSGSVLYGDLKVENVSSESEYVNGVLARKLKIRSTKGSLKSHTLKMFELYGWMKGDFIPPQADFIINLLNRVQQWQKKSGGGTVVVTCYDGYTACGFYCAASYIAGQVKSCENVDVFHAVRTVRANRPAFIPNVEQYRWLYELACSLVTNKKVLK